MARYVPLAFPFAIGVMLGLFKPYRLSAFVEALKLQRVGSGCAATRGQCQPGKGRCVHIQR